MTSGDQPGLIVGVGASAGGLDAFRTLLRALPDSTGMAFILVQHLDPTHESLLSDLLSSCTRMAVAEAKHDQFIARDRVYVIPPNASLTVEHGRLRVSEPTQRRGLRLPVDDLFRSMAAQLGPRAAAVVLSGAGSDGTAGLRAVRAAGGLAIAQTPETAGQPGMPQSAIDADAVDLVLDIDAIPAALERLVSIPVDQRGHTDAQQPAEDEAKADRRIDDETLQELNAVITARTDFDLALYKAGTVGRRLIRRMTLAGYQTPADYLDRLREDPAELQRLVRDMLISVTDFFRDPKAFDELRTSVVEPLVDGLEAGTTLRAWVVGCATGEEAYTLGILLLNAVARVEKRLAIQMFATDLDEDALRVARAGLYAASNLEHVPSHDLGRYFKHREGRGFQVVPQLRDIISFAAHDACKDPPFSRMHLVTCRNVLIYLRPQAQNRLLRNVHFALNPGGHLFLGSSEGTGTQSNAFSTVSKSHRIYRKVGTSRPLLVTRTERSQATAPVPRSSESHETPHAAEPDIMTSALLAACQPPTVVVSGTGQILYMYGELRPYFHFPQGEPRHDLGALLTTELATRVRAAIHRCRREQTRLVVHASPDASRDTRTRITAVPAHELGDEVVILTFEEEEAPPAAGPSDDTEQAALIEELDRELQATREDLRTTVEELETSNEELRAANEESMTMNEELQSANEELEATSEELRSLNEELSTVNGQLREKVEEIEEAHDDLTNFFGSTQIATVFLDDQQRIKRFTPAARLLLRIDHTDEGRQVSDIARPLLQNGLARDCEQVLDQLTPLERELSTDEARWYARRVLPYRTATRRIAGVVVTFLDITELKSAAEQLRVRERQQAVIAAMGLRALREPSLDDFLDHVVREVQQTLQTDFCKILELQPDGEDMLLRAGVGWQEGLVGRGTVPTGLDSQAGFTLRSPHPVVVHDLRTERRFSGPALLRDHGVTSGISCTIRVGDDIFGVLGAHTREPRRFTEEDTNFLQAIATVISHAISRQQSQLCLALESTLARTLTRATNLDEAFGAVHAAFVSQANAVLSELWCPATGGGELRCRAVLTEPPLDADEVLRAFSHGTFRRAEGLIGRVFSASHTEWISSLQSRTQLRRLDAARALDLGTGLAIPILAGEQTLGVMTVFATQRVLGDQSLLRVCDGIGRTVGELIRRLQAEAAIGEVERRKAAVLDASLDGIVIMDDDGVILELNAAGREMFEVSAEDVTGRHMPQVLLAPAGRTIVESAWPSDEAAEHRLSTRGLRSGGEEFPVEIALTRLVAGERPLVAASIRDLTEARRVQGVLEESERRFRGTFENAAVGIAHVALDGRWLRFNERLTEITGHTREALERQTEHALTYPADLPRQQAAVRALVAGDDPRFSLEKRYIRPDGHPTWVQFTCALSRTAEGQPDYLIAIVQDISKRREAEEALRLSEERFRRILVNSPVPMMVYDEAGRIVALSRSWSEVTGYPAETLTTLESWVRPAYRDRADEVLRYIESLWDTDEALAQTEFQIWTRGGEQRTLLFSAAPLGNTEGRRLRVCAAADVTAQKTAEASLREAARQKDEFLAMLGHELRNPLAAVRSAAQLLEVRATADADGSLGRTAEILSRQSQHMAKLLDGLLDISRIVRGTIEITRQPVDLGTVVRQVVSDAADRAEEQGLALETRLPSDPVWLSGDPVRLTQVIDNLLSNAIKFTARPGRITVTLETVGDQAQLRVADNGRGIPPELLPHIFDTFRQATQGIDRALGGLGLGLALVKALVELHGGHVEARSEGEGQGTEMRVTLPLAVVPAADAAAPTRSPDDGPIRILVIEDNVDAAELLCMLLESAGHQTEVAHTGEAGIALLESVSPQLVLCDLGLPGIDGFGVAQAIRAQPQYRDLPLVALSGYGRSEDKARSREAGFDAHLTKPADLRAIERVLSELLPRG